MGIMDNKSKKSVMNKIKNATISKVAISGIVFLVKTMLPAILITSIIATACSWITEIFQAKDTPKKIYEKLEIENMSDLVSIKGNDEEGYYLDFDDQIDKKIDDIIKETNTQTGYHRVPSKDFLKKLIKAEVYTQFPDLGGEVKTSTGLQGAVQVRRVTPNKEIEELKNTGTGNVTTKEEKVANDTVDLDSVAKETTKEWKEGEQLKVIQDSIVYKQTESELNEGEYLDHWEEVKSDYLNTSIKIFKGQTVTYTGNYKEHKDYLNGKVTGYIEVKSGELTGYILATNVQLLKTESTNNNKTENTTSENKTNTTGNTTAGNTTTGNTTAGSSTSGSSSSGSSGKGNETAGQSKEKYTVAIAAGHNNDDDKGARKDDLIEEDLTVQVAEKVEQLLKNYSNIKVVQTGSTSDNRDGVKVGDRVSLADEANPDLVIQIHFDAGGGTGAQGIYKAGDGYSAQLAEFLADSISSNMGIENDGAGSDLERCEIGSLGIIDNYANTGYPSVVTEGGFLDGSPDAEIIRSGDGVNKYAQGIAEGVVAYLAADHSGLSATATGDETITEGIDSKVYNLTYISPEKFAEYDENDDIEILKYFTMNDSNELVTAKWSTSNGNVTISANSPVNLKTVLQKYTMPFEYLYYFYIDSDYTGFSEQLADVVLDSEIVLMVEDNVKTTESAETVVQTNIYEDGRVGESNTTSSSSSITESCTPTIEITYADTWCVKCFKENSFSSYSLGWKKGQTEGNFNIKGKVTESNTTSVTSSSYEGGDGYSVYTENRKESHSISNKYASGDVTVDKNVEKFCNLYNAEGNQMSERLRERWLFQILENNENTKNLVDLTKYLIYMATDVSYDKVLEYDFNQFDFSKFGSKGFSAVLGLYGDTIEERVWFYLRLAGFSEQATAGIMGNMYQESSMDPTSYTPGVAGGICQWGDNIDGNALQGVRDLAESKGKDWTDLQCQLEYLLNTIDYSLTTYSGNGSYTYPNGEVTWWPEYKVTIDLFKEIDDVATATEIFEKTFERASIPNMPRRIGQAEVYYEQFKGRELPKGYAGGSGNIIETARSVLQYMLDTGNTYGTTSWNDIETTSESDPQYVCATYVAVVLYRAGILTADQINAYNYHWTGSGGIPDMLEAAGWYQVDPSEAQEGDVVNNFTYHVWIYGGGELVYDEACSQDMGTIEPYSSAGFYMSRGDTQVWRAP